MTAIGTALHAAIAAHLVNPDRSDAPERVRRLLAAAGMDGFVDAGQVLAAAERLRAAVEKRFAPRRIRVEYPIVHALADGRVVRRSIDVLLETEDGLVLIDDKWAPGPRGGALGRLPAGRTAPGVRRALPRGRRETLRAAADPRRVSDRPCARGRARRARVDRRAARDRGRPRRDRSQVVAAAAVRVGRGRARALGAARRLPACARGRGPQRRRLLVPAPRTARAGSRRRRPRRGSGPPLGRRPTRPVRRLASADGARRGIRHRAIRPPARPDRTQTHSPASPASPPNARATATEG